MLPDYRDIRRRLGEPIWFDARGVPRYDPFHPDLCDVYASHVALLEIACRACGERFLVAVEADRHMTLARAGREPALPSRGDPGSFGYLGDAPWHGDARGPCEGVTMTGESVRVVEFWRRGESVGWQRDPACEVPLV